MKRVLCIHLPAWPLQKLRQERPDLRREPVALVDESGPRGPVVVLYGAAERTTTAGIAPGMPVAEAVAVDHRLKTVPYDPEGDLHALRRLADWAVRFSPIVALEDAPAPQSLLLDVSGSAPLFGGERPLLDQAARGLRLQGWKARLALADTLGAAWALAHHGDTTRHLVPPGQAETALRPLPVEALRLPAETVGCLGALGIERVGQLLDLPRSSLPARLGSGVLLRLDQALGRAAEVLTPHQPPPEIAAEFAFEYPTDRHEVLCHALDLLTEQIHEQLHERHWGARRIECRLFHELGEPTVLDVGLARPSRSRDHLRPLLHTRLERVELPAPVSGIHLSVAAAEPLDDAQAALFDAERAAGERALAALIDQLSSRLGHEAVTSPRLVADPQPEHACRFEPAIAADAERTRADDPGVPYRPVRLFPRPVPIAVVAVASHGPPARFRWLNAEHHVASVWGPERIETGWWRGDDVRRDYYVVETTAGARFWIFRGRDDGRWFLHGCFD